MTWIDEMFVSMETASAAAAAKRSANAARVDRTEHVKEQIPATSELWGALVASIKNDVSEFNKHKKRAGQTAVRVSQRGFHCEVYLAGMHGKRMVLTLANNDLQVLVHPDFPKQPLTITFEPDEDGQRFLGSRRTCQKERKGIGPTVIRISAQTDSRFRRYQ
jgi:hypothetical protein